MQLTLPENSLPLLPVQWTIFLCPPDLVVIAIVCNIRFYHNINIVDIKTLAAIFGTSTATNFAVRFNVHGLTSFL
jgi:hypothetical protein